MCSLSDEIAIGAELIGNMLDARREGASKATDAAA